MTRITMNMSRVRRPFSSALLPTLLCVSVLISGRLAQADDAELDRWKHAFEEKILPILNDRCLECHNDENKEGEFNLAPYTSGDAAAAKMDVWDKVGRRIRLSEMPPAGSPGLNDPQKGAMQRWLDTRPQQDLCNQLATDETQSWYRGHVMSRRLTRTEYSNALRDLLGVTVPTDIDVPSDGAGGEGFDTAGDTLFTSPVLLEAYLRVADTLVNQVIKQDAESASAAPVRNDAWHQAGWGVADLGLQNEIVPDAVRGIIAKFAMRAWRRPVTDDEVGRLLALYELEVSRGATPRDGVAQAMKAVLVSPYFLFVVERESASGVQQLSPHELATRLALFIWSTIPDERLLELADRGEIVQPEVIRSEVRRMLADPRALALGENFGLQWLGLADLERKIQPDAEVFPEFDTALVADMRREAVETISNVFRYDQPLDYLLESPHVYANARLARHYGLELPSGDQAIDEESWQAIPVADGRRGGVLTMGAVLASTSYPRRTSPVLRGAWILAEVLGDSVPPPPPGVPPLEESVNAESPRTLRQRLELHRENKQCASCHDRIDPLGFGLENYDAIGRWRDTDASLPIDASGKLPSGQSFSGPSEFKQVIGQRSGDFRRHLVKKILGFALGRGLNKFDQCVIDESLKQLDANEHRAAVVIETICLSYPFQHRYYKPSENE